MTRKSSRRDFLRGQAAIDAAADAVGGVPSAPGGGYTVRVARQAMACEFEVFLNAGQYEDDTRRALEALDRVDAIEEQLSFFRSSSELAAINRHAAAGVVEVESGLFGLLEDATQLHRETDGALDITSTPLWEVWGFARREGRIPGNEELAEALALVGGGRVELDPVRRTVRLLQPGMRLNLGSIGKGYALDRCAEGLDEQGIFDFLLHAGGSSILGRGNSLSHGPGWPVGVPHPLRPDRRLAEVQLRNESLATSGSRAQSFVHEGRRYSHILDPRTGRPAEGLLSVTVVAPTALLADALSTAMFVMGPERSAEYAAAHPEIGVLLIEPNRQAGGFAVTTHNLDDDRIRWLE